jgi:hypothetical protein
LFDDESNSSLVDELFNFNNDQQYYFEEGELEEGEIREEEDCGGGGGGSVPPDLFMTKVDDGGGKDGEEEEEDENDKLAAAAVVDNGVVDDVTVLAAVVDNGVVDDGVVDDVTVLAAVVDNGVVDDGVVDDVTVLAAVVDDDGVDAGDDGKSMFMMLPVVSGCDGDGDVVQQHVVGRLQMNEMFCYEKRAIEALLYNDVFEQPSRRVVYDPYHLTGVTQVVLENAKFQCVTKMKDMMVVDDWNKVDYDSFDYIITMPPIPIDIEFLVHCCYKQDKQFALLVPTATIQTRPLYQLFRQFGITVFLLVSLDSSPALPMCFIVGNLRMKDMFLFQYLEMM